VLTGYKIACAVLVALFLAALAGSYYGWGLPSDASLRANSVRQGSLRGRHYYGGGPSFGK
jgi:hypothetical protein